MTVLFNSRWNGYSQFSIASLDVQDEAVLIAQGIAVAVECKHLEATPTAAAINLALENPYGLPGLYIRLVTFDSAESLKIGFGATHAAAKAAAASGLVFKSTEQMMIAIPAGLSLLGFVSVGGNVDFYYTFGEL